MQMMEILLCKELILLNLLEVLFAKIAKQLNATVLEIQKSKKKQENPSGLTLFKMLNSLIK